jgi:hypothetical protein
VSRGARYAPPGPAVTWAGSDVAGCDVAGRERTWAHESRLVSCLTRSYWKFA